MDADRLRPTADPLVRRNERGVAYTERPCAYEPCGKLAWMEKKSAFCSRPCASLSHALSGASSSSWLGNDAGYKGRHQRVYKARGKADHCSLRPSRGCTCEDYEWAQIHGTDGLDVREYIALCVPCHRAYDSLAGCVPKPAIQGGKNGRAKLTGEIVLACRARAAAGETKAALARKYKVARPTMRDAILGITWASVR